MYICLLVQHGSTYVSEAGACSPLKAAKYSKYQIISITLLVERAFIFQMACILKLNWYLGKLNDY